MEINLSPIHVQNQSSTSIMFEYSTKSKTFQTVSDTSLLDDDADSRQKVDQILLRFSKILRWDPRPFAFSCILISLGVISAIYFLIFPLLCLFWAGYTSRLNISVGAILGCAAIVASVVSEKIMKKFWMNHKGKVEQVEKYLLEVNNDQGMDWRFDLTCKVELMRNLICFKVYKKD